MLILSRCSYSHQNMTRITNIIASHLILKCRLYNYDRTADAIHFVAHFDVCSQWATNTDTKKGNIGWKMGLATAQTKVCSA